MAQENFGIRDRSGEWRPGLVQTAPLFVWPPRPIQFLKWLFGYEGYLLPWQVTYVAIAVVTWLFLTPDLARMKVFEVGWVATIYARNFGLLLLIAGAWHTRLYMQKAQGEEYKYTNRWLATKNSTFLFGNQTHDNMFWGLASGCAVWTAYEVGMMWCYANHLLPYVDWHAHPIYCTSLLFAISVFHDLHFYVFHRLLHWRPLYTRFHKLHHKNVNVGPWSGLAMHPVEHVLYFSGVLLLWIIPSHPLHALRWLQYVAILPAQGHCGFESVVIKGQTAVKTGNYYHQLHHKYFEVNYGGDGTVPTDKWFGTFHDGSDEATEAMKQRRKPK